MWKSPWRPRTSNLWNQLWQRVWIDLIFEPLKWYSCSRIFSEQSYWKVDYPLSAVTDLQAINVSVIFYFYFWGVGGILFQKLFEWQVAVLLQKCNSKLSTTSSSDLENRFYFGHLVSSLKFPTDRLLGWPWSDQHQQLKQLRKKKNGFWFKWVFWWLLFYYFGCHFGYI